MAPAARAAITATTATIDAWLKAGYDLELDVLPVIAERTAKPRGSLIRTWDYFSQAIAARHAKRIAQAARSQGGWGSWRWLCHCALRSSGGARGAKRHP